MAETTGLDLVLLIQPRRSPSSPSSYLKVPIIRGNTVNLQLSLSKNENTNKNDQEKRKKKNVCSGGSRTPDLELDNALPITQR